MKTYCKRIDIGDPAVILPWVYEAFEKKWKKKGFVHLLEKYGGITRAELEQEIAAQEMHRRNAAVEKVAEEVARRIRSGELDLIPMRKHYKCDELSGKTRELIKESPMQQILDYVAANALMPLFMAKLSPHQCACIRNRGQSYGKRFLERWIRRDRKARHVRKGDVKKCYAHISRPTVLRLLGRDIHKNKLLLWLVDQLLRMHEAIVTGLAIGSYLSAWLCNYVLSYLFRYANGLTKIRRRHGGGATEIRLVRHVLFYADDFVLIGARAADVEKAMKLTAEYAEKELGLEIHENWDRIDLKYGHVDMMGFVVNYHRTTIRRRIFRRLRRQYLRAGRELAALGYVPHWRARKICSYKGYFDHTDTKIGAERLNACVINKAAARSVSYADARRKERTAA